MSSDEPEKKKSRTSRDEGDSNEEFQELPKGWEKRMSRSNSKCVFILSLK